MANKQPIKKGTGTISAKNGFAAFKEKAGYDYNNADKPMEWITMPPAFLEAVRLPGFPKGYVSSILGHSNTGKSTLINHAITEAQRQGDIPVIIDTENSFDFTYAISMGFKATPKYAYIDVVDETTGETHKEEQIVSYEGDFIYFNNAILAERYGKNDYSTGKEVSKKRKIAVVEDVAQCINDLLDAQDDGEFDQGLLFVWDSVGSIGSWQEYTSGKKANNMWNAGAIATSMNGIINDRIPRSRKIGHIGTNTFIMIQKLSIGTTATGIATAKGKGGYALHYAARLELFLGGITSASTKTLMATSKGVNFNYATETKVKVPKAHLPSPFDVSSEGKFICTSTGIIKMDEIDEYKKAHLSQIISELNKVLESSGSKEVVDINEIEFVEKEEDE